MHCALDRWHGGLEACFFLPWPFLLAAAKHLHFFTCQRVRASRTGKRTLDGQGTRRHQHESASDGCTHQLRRLGHGLCLVTLPERQEEEEHNQLHAAWPERADICGLRTFMR